MGWSQGGEAVRSREEAPEAKEGIPGIRDRGEDPETVETVTDIKKNE